MKAVLVLACFALLSTLTLAFDGEERDATGCPVVFQKRCQCGKTRYHYWRNKEEIYMVNCTNSHFQHNTTMLEYLPSETQVLIFNGNNIPSLNWNIFGIWDAHKNLEVVDLTNNNIRDISGKTFHKVKYVKRLVLDHNDLIISGPNLHPRLLSNFESLEELHLTNTFTETVDSRWYLSDLKEILLTSKMDKLKKLHLEQNEIWEIKDEDMFCNLKNLTELHLGDNQLQAIDFSLDCLEQLRYLNLEYNKIRRLSQKTLKNLDIAFKDDKYGSKTLNLKGNPFRCDCYMRPMFDWLVHTNISFFHKEELRCFDGYPLGNAGRAIMELEKLDCSPPPVKRSENSSSTPFLGAFILFFVICVILVCIMLYMFWSNSYGFKDKVKPMVDQFQKSMQYKTINRDEDFNVTNKEEHV